MTTQLAEAWKRHTGPRRIINFLLSGFILAAFIISLRNIEIIPEFLKDTPAQMADLFKRMWPIDWKFFQFYVIRAIFETINIATLGTMLTLIVTFPLALMASNSIIKSQAVRMIPKFIFVASRSVNSLIWALFYVAVFGPGALAGVMAITSRSIGFVGKLLSEALEQVNRNQIEAVTSVGANPVSVFLKGYWPQIKPSFISISLLRWDINIRETAVLGLVGAGGIGLLLESAIDIFKWRAVAAILVAILAVVLIAEFLVTRLRKKII